MIIDFTISNFRSIKNEQSLSFYAEGSHLHLPNNIRFPADNNLGILTSAGIYGANASGKSNFLTALLALRSLVIDSDDLKDGEEIESYEPFRLCAESKNSPTLFEIEFVVDSKRYLYRIVFNAYKILEESLDFYPSRNKANIFKREEGKNWKEIKFGSLYKGGKKAFPFFENNSYLSKAGNSADAPEIIRKVYDFFRQNLIFRDLNKRTWRFNQEWKKDIKLVNKVAAILSKVDTGINGLTIQKEDNSAILTHLPKDMPEHIKNRLLDEINHVTYFQHPTEENTNELFSENDESTGTITLYHALPLIFKVFEKGSVLVWDEIESSLHPHIAELIVKLFNDPKANVNYAQLLFTSHNLNLMSPNLLRKDQIWLTEKKQGVSVISSLDNFDASALKSNSPFAKWYADSRLGGVPEINYHAICELLTQKTINNAEVQK